MRCKTMEKRFISRQKALLFFITSYVLYCNLWHLNVQFVMFTQREALTRRAIDGSAADASTIVKETKASSERNDSVFDCDANHGKCSYFYPSHFFVHSSDAARTLHPQASFGESQYAKGKKFNPLLQELDALLRERKLWLQMPSVFLWTMSFTEDKENPVTGRPFQPLNLTFIHVHKTGGTTIIWHTKLIERLTGIPVKRFTVYRWKWIDEKFISIDSSAYLNGSRFGTDLRVADSGKRDFDQTLDHLRHATRFKTPSDPQWKATDHQAFGIVRDPTERFVSMIGQAFGAWGSSKNGGVAQELQRDCISSHVYTLEASRFTLQCVVDKIKERGYFFEMHFTPQAIELAFSTQMIPGLPISVFPFQHLPAVLEEIGCDPNIKARDGAGDKKYRPFPVLSNMSVDDYTPELTRQICELYEVDVILMRSLGWHVPRCDPYV